ncbi:hypothetical protein ANO11243_019330 [Dothideomycetidae sp. 11243]|nr:hypothetical protein ANO11243_019330 [fungal sp. No.11243]
MAQLVARPSTSLYDRLAKNLPSSNTFTFHHISTPPTKCDPLYAALPGAKPERTYCESHFLTVSAPRNARLVLLFAIEVLIFTTKRLTTVFVSKADSTGCLASLKITAGGSASIVRTIAAEFVSWLVKHRQRPRTRLVLSLFARAQGQYLFPASADNKGKHVLDDRQLVKWWCKTLDPVMRQSDAALTTQAYVIVLGFDRQETTAFFPPSHRSDPPDARKWVFGHPLEKIAIHPTAPPRCLVPRFPDDPKARFLDELDEEIPDATGPRLLSSPSKKGSGMWKSIKTLSQFWEMMAFRQECSSGRLVGFIWVVFTPNDGETQEDEETENAVFSPASPSPGAARLPPVVDDVTKERIKKPLSGPIVPRLPRVKRMSSSVVSSSIPEHSPFWKWPESSRGQVVVDSPTYDRIHDLLLRLDFQNDDAATESTVKWFEEAAKIAGNEAAWGREVVGTATVTTAPDNGHTNGTAKPTTASAPNDLSASIVRKKRKAEAAPESVVQETIQPVNMLSSGLVRRKPKP